MGRFNMEMVELQTRDTPFFTNHEREEIFLASEKLTHLIKEGGIKNVIFVDASARPISTGLTTYWHKASPDEPLPGIYFVNPDGFHSMSQKDFLPDDIERRMAVLMGVTVQVLRRMMGYNPPEKEHVLPAVVQRFSEVHHRLIQQKDLPTMIVDTCIHTGSTVQKVSEVLRAAGFDHVTVAAVSPDSGTAAQADTYLLDKTAINTCYPFGPEGMVEKGDDVISRPADEPAARIVGNRLRQEIKEIIEERFRPAP